jgi:MFS family permease
VHRPEPTIQHSCLIAASPVYFGWVVVVAATIGVAMTTPGQTVGVSVFVDRIVESLGISRPTVSLLYAIGTLGGSLALPFVGGAIDRYGPRIAVVVISLLFAGGCVWMGWVQGTATGAHWLHPHPQSRTGIADAG